MALGNYAQFVMDKFYNKISSATEFEDITIEFYKNWIYLYDDKFTMLPSDGTYKFPIPIMEIKECNFRYKGIYIKACRGPQDGIYVVAWKKDNLILGTGCYAYEDYERGSTFVGIKNESISFLKDFHKKVYEEDYCPFEK